MSDKIPTDPPREFSRRDLKKWVLHEVPCYEQVYLHADDWKRLGYPGRSVQIGSHQVKVGRSVQIGSHQVKVDRSPGTSRGCAVFYARQAQKWIVTRIPVVGPASSNPFVTTGAPAYVEWRKENSVYPQPKENVMAVYQSVVVRRDANGKEQNIVGEVQNFLAKDMDAAVMLANQALGRAFRSDECESLEVRVRPFE